MKRATIGAGLIALLAGCGGQPSSVTRQADGSVTVEKAGATVTVDATECKRPDFVAIQPDAKIRTCVGNAQGGGRVSGSVIYTTATPSAAVLAASKDHAARSGLKLNLENDMTLSASAGKRTLMVMAMPDGSATGVTVNWGEEP